MFKCFGRSRVRRAAVILVLPCSLLSTTALGGEGFLLSATSSPALSIGFEKGWIGIYAGAGFRWSENLGESITYDPVNDGFVLSDVRTSATVVAPALSLRLLSPSTTLPGYLAMQVEKDIPVATSADGFGGDANAAYEEYLQSQNSMLRISGGLGIRVPLSERLSLGGEVGVWFSTVSVELPSSLQFGAVDDERNFVSTYFRLAMFLYL